MLNLRDRRNLSTSACTPQLRFVLAIFVLAMLTLMVTSVASPEEAHALSKGYKGHYSYMTKGSELWGKSSAPLAEPGYALSLDILKVKGNKVSFKIEQSHVYGNLGYYSIGTKVITAKLRKGYAKFNFKSYSGDRGVGRIKLLSKNRVKVSLKTTYASGKERMPLTTGGKYKTLKRR